MSKRRSRARRRPSSRVTRERPWAARLQALSTKVRRVPILDVILLGVLEGLTEFLPVSSTGHLILLSQVLGHDSDADKTLDVVIQLGAVLAVVVYYRARLLELARGAFAKDKQGRALAIALAVAFMPAAIVGLTIHGWIKQHLFGPVPVAAALVVGGVVMIVVEAWRKRAGEAAAHAGDSVHDVTRRRAFIVGLAQCASLWPGASRSMSTIVGGQLSGLSTATAAEFSFLLAIPTLGAATLFDLWKNGRVLLEAPSGLTSLAVGLVTSFVVAMVVIAAFLKFLRRFGLAPFGWYRIVVGCAVLGLTLFGSGKIG
jgi:undecaprenyl-diphosphatase